MTDFSGDSISTEELKRLIEKIVDNQARLFARVEKIEAAMAAMSHSTQEILGTP